MDSVKVLYEDNHLLALFKPPGLLVQRDKTGDPCALDWARDWIRHRYHKPGRVFVGLVHRLDRPVGGVLVLARTSKAASRLSTQFRERRVRKLYWAVVQGHLEPQTGFLSAHFKRTSRKSVVAAGPNEAGKYGALSYRTLERSAGASLLEVRLITGRHHQIRSHLAHLGHPILGDLKYGFRSPRPIQGIALLARAVTCNHPTRPMQITFESPIPETWPWPHL